MKRAIGFLVAIMLICGTAFAGGFNKCSYPAFSYCAEKMKVRGTTGPNGEVRCTVLNPRGDAFRGCEDDARKRCEAGEVLDLTQKPC